MKILCGLALGALLALAGGCVSIGADESASGGRLVYVGQDAADFARAHVLDLEQQAAQLEDIEGVLGEQKYLAMKTWQDWLDREAGAWNDPHFREMERPFVATAFDGLAQESMDQSDRYHGLIGTYDSRVSCIFMERAEEKRNMEAFSTMTLVAP